MLIFDQFVDITPSYNIKETIISILTHNENSNMQCVKWNDISNVLYLYSLLVLFNE